MKIGVAGLGLIGGSLALALRRRHDVTGFDPDPGARDAAIRSEVGVVSTLEDLLPADCVIVAVPLDATVPTLERLAARADGTVLLDTASLKRGVSAYAERAPEAARIVGGHPMAGSTSSGFAAADAHLFRGRSYLLVPTARSDDEAMAVAGGIVRDIGAAVMVCSADVHDRAMATLSAAPLAAAIALAASAQELGALVATAGPGFRDSTRLADTGSNFALQLLLRNSEHAPMAIRNVATMLEATAESIERGEEGPLRELLEAARRVRARLG